MATKPKIYIKPSKRGTLRKAMGAKKDEKLSVSSMKKKMESASPAMRKKLNFAINARKWKHGDGGPLNLASSFANASGLSGLKSSMNTLRPTNNPLTNSGGSEGFSMGFDPVSLGLSALTAIGGSIGANMATQKSEMYSDAAENMQTVDINEATKGSGIQSFLQNPLSLGIGGKKKAKLEAEEFNENILKQVRNKNVASRFSTMSDAPTYTPVARQGGFIAYKGQTHDDSDGGILVDKFGNPTAVSQEESVASVEGGGKHKKGEVSYYDPELGSTYIYSDSLKFARPARRLLNKYKLDKPETLQYKQYKNDLLTQTMIKKKFENLTTAQEFAKETNSSMEDSMGVFKNGGYLSSSKAKEMLRDGTVHGKKLTAKQKRYFGWVAGGKKEEGGELDKRTVLMPKENLEYDRDLRMNRDWMGALKQAKDLDSMYSTPVGTWKGNPMSLQQFTEMPEYVTNYYNPNYAIEFNKNRLGLPNTFQDINLGKVKQDPSLPRYQPAYTITPGNDVAYYKKGGYVPMYPDGGWLKKFKENYNKLTGGKPLFKQLFQPLGAGDVYPEGWSPSTASPMNTGEVLERLIPGSYGQYDPMMFNLGLPEKPIVDDWTYTGGKLRNNFSIPQEQEVKSSGVGRSKPIIARKENPLAQKVAIPKFNMSTFGTKAPQVLSGPPKPFEEEADEYGASWLNPAGHLLSAAGSLADYNAMKKARPDNVSLGRVGAERVSLAKQRLSNIRNAATAKAMASSAARSSGMNAGVALSNTLAANTGANRLLGQQNAELLQNEENTNAQMRQQANMVNAELAAQEGLFNTQQQNAYKMMMAQNNPLGNMARTAAGYFADNAAYQQDYDTLQMLAPNAELYRDPDAGFLKKSFGRQGVRMLDRNKYSIEELKKMGLLNTKTP